MSEHNVTLASYSVGPNAYQDIPTFCRIYGTKAVVIGGKKAMAAAEEKLRAAVRKTDLSLGSFLLFGKDCTYQTAEKLEQIEEVRQADMIFAVGGGKAVDTCKLLCHHLGKPCFTFPTLASNCASSSALSIVYKEDGSFCDFFHHEAPACHVFIDTEIIAASPREYMWAGIGDTYAKYYEVAASARGRHPEYYTAMGVNISRMCMETLLLYGEEALRNMDEKKVTPALEQTALGIIITTGWVSTLVSRDHTMDYNGGVGHAFFYGLCNMPGFEEDHIHGVVVALGILLLLLIDGEEEEYQTLSDFNRRVGLPTSLSDVGVTLEQVKKCASLMTEDEDLKLYPYKVTEEMIIRAAERLDF